MVEPPPSSPFIVIESEPILELLVGKRDEFGEVDLLRYGGEPVLGGLRRFTRPLDDEPFHGP
jgi:hypothetical protein